MRRIAFDMIFYLCRINSNKNVYINIGLIMISVVVNVVTEEKAGKPILPTGHVRNSSRYFVH